MKVAILANGEMKYPAQVRALASQADLLLAADGGALHALALELWPHLVVGDLDSLSVSQRETLTLHGVRCIQHPAQKDETDLELALLQAVVQGATQIVVLTALGGRTDQFLANLLLLTLPALRGVRCWIVDGVEQVFLVRGRAEISGQAGDVLSLLPLGGDCEGVWTEGLAYPLRGEGLRFGPARGVSNVLLAPRATVTVERGTLLAVLRSQRVVMQWPGE